MRVDMVTCPICNGNFKSTASLRTHRSRYHGSNNTQTMAYKDTPVPDDNALDSANKITDGSDIESEKAKDNSDVTDNSLENTEASDNAEDTEESDISTDNTENTGDTSEYENSDSSVSPVKRKVYRKRRDALSFVISSRFE